MSDQVVFACDRIEQELMARVISQMHYDTHDDTMTQHHDVIQDVSEVTEGSRTPADSFIGQ